MEETQAVEVVEKTQVVEAGAEPHSEADEELASIRKLAMRADELRVDLIEADDAKKAAADAAKRARERFEVASFELINAIKGQQEEHPLFDKAVQPWRDTPLIDVLDLKLANLLANTDKQETPITTLGELTAWTGKHELTDLVGVGASKAQEIEDQIVNFWAANPGLVQKVRQANQ